jgi:sugar phosphate permease
MTLYATFAVRVIGLSVQVAGLTLSLGGLIGLIGSVPVVALLDRVGPRSLQVRIYLFRAVGYAGIALFHSVLLFILLVPVVGIFDRASGPVVQALVAEGFSGQERTLALSYLRRSRNIGFILGSLTGTVAFVTQSGIAYAACILVNSVSFLIAAVGYMRLRASWDVVGPAARASAGLPVLRAAAADVKYVKVAAIQGVLALHGSVLTFAIPLWIADHTRAPHWIIPVLFTLNCCIAIGVQTRASRRSEDLGIARRISAFAGILLALCCLFLVLAGRLTIADSAVFLIVAIALLTLAEVWQAAGAATLSLDLAPTAARGAYLSVFNFFLNGQGVYGPIILALCVNSCSTGMIALAAMFLATAALMAFVPLTQSIGTVSEPAASQTHPSS